MNKEKAKYYSELLLDMAEVAKYVYGIMADVANFIELQQKECVNDWRIYGIQ